MVNGQWSTRVCACWWRSSTMRPGAILRGGPENRQGQARNKKGEKTGRLRNSSTWLAVPGDAILNRPSDLVKAIRSGQLGPATEPKAGPGQTARIQQDGRSGVLARS